MDDTVTVTRIHVPANSTLGFGYGIDEHGTPAIVVGESRAMAAAGEALSETREGILVIGIVIVRGIAATQMAESWTAR